MMRERRRRLVIPVVAGIIAGAIVSVLTSRVDRFAAATASSDAGSAGPMTDALPSWTFEAQMASFDAESSDSAWSPAMTARLASALAQAADPISVRIALVECRRTFCRAEAEFPSYQAASAQLAGFFSAIRIARCGKAYSLALPDDSGGSYRLPLVFACARDRTP